MIALIVGGMILLAELVALYIFGGWACVVIFLVFCLFWSAWRVGVGG